MSFGAFVGSASTSGVFYPVNAIPSCLAWIDNVGSVTSLSNTSVDSINSTVSIYNLKTTPNATFVGSDLLVSGNIYTLSGPITVSTGNLTAGNLKDVAISGNSTITDQVVFANATVTFSGTGSIQVPNATSNAQAVNYATLQSYVSNALSMFNPGSYVPSNVIQQSFYSPNTYTAAGAIDLLYTLQIFNISVDATMTWSFPTGANSTGYTCLLLNRGTGNVTVTAPVNGILGADARLYSNITLRMGQSASFVYNGANYQNLSGGFFTGL